MAGHTVTTTFSKDRPCGTYAHAGPDLQCPKVWQGLQHSTALLREPYLFFSMQAFTGLDVIHLHYAATCFT